MKRVLAVLCCCLCCGLCAACANPFDKVNSATYPEKDQIATQFLAVLQTDNLTESEIAAFFSGPNSIPAQINAYAAALLAADPDTTEPYLAEAAFNAEQSDSQGYTLDVTVHHLPPQTVTVTTKVWTQERTREIANPLRLLAPALDPELFTYFHFYLALVDTTRYHWTSANHVEQATDGRYYYFWRAGAGDERVLLTERLPNRTLYLVIALAGAAVVGVVVYLVAKRRCKNPATPL